jgi:hypothetical protein
MQALHTLTQIAQPTEAEVRYVLEFIHKLKREGDGPDQKIICTGPCKHLRELGVIKKDGFSET